MLPLLFTTASRSVKKYDTHKGKQSVNLTPSQKPLQFIKDEMYELYQLTEDNVAGPTFGTIYHPMKTHYQQAIITRFLSQKLDESRILQRLKP